MQPRKSRLLRAIPLCATILSCTSTPVPPPKPVPTPIQELSGWYTSTTREDWFVPCGVKGVGDGWSLDFPRSREAPFLKGESAVRGFPALSHFIRVRGTLGPPGRYNLGFQSRQFTVDTVLDVKESMQPCQSYEDFPEPWSGLPQKGNFVGVTFSDDRSLVAVLDRNGHIEVWATDRGQRLRAFADLGKQNLSSRSDVPMAFSPDRKLLAVGGIDGKVRIWRISDRKEIYTLSRSDSASVAYQKAHNTPVTIDQVDFNNSGSLLASTNMYSTIVWSLETGEPVGELHRGLGFYHRAFFLDDTRMLVAGDSGQITVYPSPTGAPAWSAKTGAAVSQNVALARDRVRVAINGRSDTIYLWSVGDGLTRPAFLTPNSSNKDAISFSPDGQMLAIPGDERGLYLWDTRTGAPIRSFHKFPAGVARAWFSADGRSIISYATYDDRFRVVHLDPRSTALIVDSAMLGPYAVPSTPGNQPQTIAAIVKGSSDRAVPDAEVTLSNGDAPDVVLQRATTSSGGYVSFTGVRFPHAIFRVRRAGFEPGTKYIHVHRGAQGPYSIVLKSELSAPAE